MKTGKQGSQSLSRILESRYWKEEDAREILAAWARRGGSARSFAQSHGLSPARLLRWKNRLSSRGRPAMFHPVKVIAAEGDQGAEAEGGPRGALELVVGDRRRIVVRRGFDPEVLADLVRAVESWEC